MGVLNGNNYRNDPVVFSDMISFLLRFTFLKISFEILVTLKRNECLLI